MPLRDLLKKRDKIREDGEGKHNPPPTQSPTEFTIMRSDTNTQELIQPPSFPEEDMPPDASHDNRSSKLVSRFRSSSNASTASKASGKGEKRLSQRLHLRSASRTSSVSSVIPEDLPAIEDGAIGSEEKEAKWEERATILAKENPNTNCSTAVPMEKGDSRSRGNCQSRPQVIRNISDAKGDVGVGNLSKRDRADTVIRKPFKKQSGFMKPEVRRTVGFRVRFGVLEKQTRLTTFRNADLEQSTAMFGRLAEDNAMAQILYGLALRFVLPDPKQST